MQCNNRGLTMHTEREDPHRSPSPPRTAERLFGIGNVLETKHISAALLAEHIRSTDRVSSLGYISSKTSIATDDFHSVSSTLAKQHLNAQTAAVVVTPPSDIIATNFISNTLSDDYSSEDEYPPPYSVNREIHFELDQNIFSQPIAEELESKAASDITEIIVFENTEDDPDFVGKFRKSRTPELVEEVVNPSMSTETNPTVVSDGEVMHVDAAEKIYDAAKDVWSWGKGVFFVSTFLGMAEGVAGNVVRIATGDSLEAVDRHVTDHIQGLDDKILNPAIAFLVQALLKAAGNTEDVMKPIIIKILTPFGLIKTTAENPELTPVAGVTVSEA